MERTKYKFKELLEWYDWVGQEYKDMDEAFDAFWLQEEKEIRRAILKDVSNMFTEFTCPRNVNKQN